MTAPVLSKESLERIRGIHRLSQRYNQLVGMPHQRRLLELMRKHVDEIEELAGQGEAHYLVETGDLLILCYELLLEGSASIDEMTVKCFGRYEKKLGELIEEVKSEE